MNFIFAFKLIPLFWGTTQRFFKLESSVNILKTSICSEFSECCCWQSSTRLHISICTSGHNHTRSVWRSTRWIPAKLMNRKHCTVNRALCCVSRFWEASFSLILKANILFKDVYYYIFKETSLYKIWVCLEYEYSRWVS